jgi:general secretion pathway protein F
MSAVSKAAEPYFFVAATANGGRTLGVRQAAGERALAESLRRERLLLMRSYRLPAWAVRERALLLKDRAPMNDQLGQLLSRGVPLVEALEVTASAVSPAARPIVEQLKESVAAGSAFSDACQKAGVFDRVSVAVYRAAERTGDLAGTCKQLAENARRQLRVQQRVTTLLIYPMIVVCLGLAVTAVMITVVVPMIADSLRRMSVELPWITASIAAVGGFVRSNMLLVTAVVAAVAIAVILTRRAVGAAIARALRRTPMVRDVVLASELARFFSVMAAMTRSGVPLADALGVANEAIGMPALRQQLGTLRTRLIEGGVLRNLIEAVSALPLATRRLLIAAERAGDMETAFTSLAADMAEELDRRSSRLLAALEPALIIALFLIIGSLILSVMIPMMSVAQKAI